MVEFVGHVLRDEQIKVNRSTEKLDMLLADWDGLAHNPFRKVIVVLGLLEYLLKLSVKDVRSGKILIIGVRFIADGKDKLVEN